MTCQTRRLVIHRTVSQVRLVPFLGTWIGSCESKAFFPPPFWDVTITMPAWYPMRVFSSYPTPHIHPRAFPPCLIAAFLVHTPSHLFYPSYLLFIGPGFSHSHSFSFYNFFFSPLTPPFFSSLLPFFTYIQGHICDESCESSQLTNPSTKNIMILI